MRKKLFVFLMAFFMVAALCCGCASNANNLEDNKSQTIVDVDQNKDGTSTLDEDQTNIEETEDDDQLQGMASGNWSDYRNSLNKSSDGYFHITSPGQLAEAAYQIDRDISFVFDNGTFNYVESFRAGTFVLDRDLDMSTHNWNIQFGTGSGSVHSHNFRGTFYGEGRTIYGLTSNLFGTTSGATIRRLNVVSSGATSIVGTANSTTIEECTFGGSPSVSGTYIGPIACYMNGGTIKYCINYADYTINNASGSYIGGIVGYMTCGDIDGCVNLGDFGNIGLNGTTGAVGGIVGRYNSSGNGKIVDCINYATIATNSSGAFRYVGGIVGYVYDNCRIDRNINFGNILVGAQNAKYVGGIAGQLGESYTAWNGPFYSYTAYRNHWSLTNCISYGSVGGTEAGSVIGLTWATNIRGCYGRNSSRVGTWGCSSSGYDLSWIDYWGNLYKYETEAFYTSGTNHGYDFSSNDIGGFTAGSWRNNFSAYYRFDTTAYDYLSGKSNNRVTTTLENIYSNKSPMLSELEGTLTISVKYKKNGVSGDFDPNDQYVTISSTDGRSSNTSLDVKFLVAAPYRSGSNNTSMNIFRIAKSETANAYLANDVTGYEMNYDGETWKCDNVKVSGGGYNSTYSYVRFNNFVSSNLYQACAQRSKGPKVTLYFTAKAKNVSFSSNVSGCKIKYNGTEISSKSYYYRDSLAGISVTPRLGYYLAEVKDNYHSSALYTGTTLGTINLSTKSDWYRYSLTKVTCTFKPVTYSVSVYYDGRLVDNSKTWTIGQKEDFVVSNDTFSPLSAVPFGYNYAYSEYSMIYGSSEETRKNTLSSSYYDMDTSVSGKQSSSAIYVASSEKKLKTSLQDFLNGATLYDSSWTNVTTSCLSSNQLSLYLSASSIQYTLDMFKGFEDENESTGNIPGKTGVSIKVYNASGTLLKNYPESSSDGTTDSIMFKTDSSYKIDIGAFRGYQILGYRIHITPKRSLTKPTEIKYEESIKSREDGSIYYDVTDLSSIYTLKSKTIQHNGEDLFIKSYLTNAFDYMKQNDLLEFDFSEANLAKYYDFYIKVVYKPLAYNIDVKVDGTSKTLSKESENDFNASVAWRQLKNENGNVTVKVTAKNYLKSNNLTSVYYYDSVTITAKETYGLKRCLGIYLGDKLLTTKNVYTFIVDPNKFGSDNGKILSLSFNVKYSNSFATTATTKGDSHIYEVSSVDDLEWLSKEVSNGKDFSGYIFNQTQDINMSGVKFKPIGNKENSFNGVYNGNGYRIKNLKFDDENLNYIGLFGNVNGATIKNLTIDGGNFTGYNYVGIFAGKAINTKFENIHNVNCNLTTNKIEYIDIYGNGLTQKTIDYTIDSSIVENKTLNGDNKANRWWLEDPDNHSNEVYDVARNSTLHGIGGIVGFAQNCQFLAVSANAKFVNGDSNINNVVGAMIGYGTGNTIDQCYAKPTTGSNVTEILANGNNTSSHVYISGHYSDDENTRRSLTDIWMQLNGEWVLKIFYW